MNTLKYGRGGRLSDSAVKSHAGNGKPFNGIDPAALNKISTELRYKEMFENMFEWGKRRR